MNELIWAAISALLTAGCGWLAVELSAARRDARNADTERQWAMEYADNLLESLNIYRASAGQKPLPRDKRLIKGTDNADPALN